MDTPDHGTGSPGNPGGPGDPGHSGGSGGPGDPGGSGPGAGPWPLAASQWPAPQWPRPVPPPTAARSRGRLWFWAAYTTIVTVAAVAAVFVVVSSQPDVGELSSDPAAAIAGAPAIELSYTYTAPDGTESTGRFTITDDGHATGTVLDQFAGAATVHTTPDGSAVLGDEAWWQRRAPSQSGAVKDQWVQPDAGTALPIDPAAEFDPTSLAELIRAIGEQGTVDADMTMSQGVPVVATTWRDWTLVRTDAHPSELLSLSGPLDSELFHTAAAPDATGETEEAAPSIWDGEPVDTVRAQAVATDLGNIVLKDVIPGGQEVKQRVREETGRTFNGQNADPGSTEATEAPAEAQPLPPLTDFPVTAPEFTAVINAPYCTTPTCPVSATVTNVGDGPGTAQVTMSVIPGLSPVTDVLGPIDPGKSETTPTKSIPNPAPTPAPGQTSTGTAQVLVSIYSPEIGGSTPERYNSLVEKLGGPEQQPALDRVLAPLAEAAKTTMVEAMHRMLDAETPVDDTLTAAEQAVEADPAHGNYSEIPLVQRLAAAGDRFTSWGAVSQQLASVDPVELPAYLPGITTAVEELANPAAPTVSLTYLPTDLPAEIPAEAAAPMDAVVVSDYPEEQPTRCTGITAVPDADPAAGIARAIANAAEQAEGCTVYARLVIPRTDRSLWTATSPELEAWLQPATGLICDGGDPAFESLTLVNGTGTHQWPLSSLCALASAPSTQEIIERLNGMGLEKPVLTELAAKNLVTLSPDDQITAINWRDPERDCTPTYTDGGVKTDEPASSPNYHDGPKAVFASAYLCKPLRKGTPAGQFVLWDWPKDESGLAAESKSVIYHRCHLVARELGGYGSTEADLGNLVTCFWGTNQAMRNGIERFARRQVAQGEHLFYLSVPQFGGPDGELSGIRVIAVGNKGYFSDGCYTNEFFDPTVIADSAC
ncbi:hypothetical protein [Glycomyces tenuis]|uniref:hypothetical protein n=1 Tax=Glycomyces tenuis TaxID=58116 RepID=UPI0003F74C12|nr:hypothetical protein [Glycomyces tenuis]